MNVIGDQLTPLAGHILGSAAADAPRELIILAVALFAILPLCLLQSLQLHQTLGFLCVGSTAAAHKDVHTVLCTAT